MCRPYSEIHQTTETFTAIPVIWKIGPSLTLLLLGSAKTGRFCLASQLTCLTCNSEDAKKRTRVLESKRLGGWIGASKCEGSSVAEFVRRPVRKIAKGNYYVSVSLSVCLHGPSRLLLDGFSWNLIFEYFPKICRENWSFIKIVQV